MAPPELVGRVSTFFLLWRMILLEAALVQANSRGSAFTQWVGRTLVILSMYLTSSLLMHYFQHRAQSGE